MKKVILTLLTFLSLHVSATMVEKEISIDFQKFPELWMSPSLDFSTIANHGQTNCTNYMIRESEHSPVTVSFSTGVGTLGAAIYRVDEYYSLILRSFCDMIFEVSDGCQITSIKFYNTNSIASCTPGRFDTNANTWYPNGATDVTRVKLTNGVADSQISLVTIKYLAPASSLDIVSSDPADGAKPDSFSSMQLSFSTAVSKVNAGNITLTGTSFTGAKNMAVDVVGLSATLKLGETLTTAGTYTVHIPAGIFETSEGATNGAKDITFSIVPNFIQSVDPKSGTVGILPNLIKVTFTNLVKIGSGTILFENGDVSFGIGDKDLKIDENDPKSVLITHNKKMVEAATWTVTIPEKLFSNDFPESDPKYCYNKETVLTYIVDGSQAGPQDSEIMKEAKLALEKTGVGYPAKTNLAWEDLNTKVNAGADDAVLQAALNNLYNVTDVQMPVVGNWYSIAGINSIGTKVYLTFNEDKTKVLLGTNKDKAAAFKVTSVAGDKVVFQTKEGWFLHVPHTLPKYKGTSKKNLTPEETDVNKLSLVKFSASSVSGAEPKALYGALTIYGSLGTIEDKEDFAYASISYADDDFDFSTYPNFENLLFSSSESSAFIFEDSKEPEETVNYIHPTLSFSPSSTIKKPGDELYLCITGPTNTVVLDNAKIYFMKGQEKQILSQPVLKLTETPNKFSVYTKGLAAGATYQLVVQEGAFKYTNPEGKFVVDSELSIALTIGEGLTLSANLSPTELTSGEEMVLTITNVVDASLAPDAQPYYQYADGDNIGQKVAYAETILTKIADSKTQFKVNTSNLEPGNYNLVLPLGTFTYNVESGKEVEDAEIVLKFTINTPVEDFNYTYTNFVFVTTKDRNKKGIDVIRDVDLNDFVICVFDFWGYSALYGNPNGKVSARSTFGGDVVSGHFEEYSTAELVENYGEEYERAWALKFVPDNPIVAGQLDDRPGMYAYYIYPGAIGDQNYEWYLSGEHPEINQTDCVVNPGMAASKYYVNNDKATGINNVSTDNGRQDVFFDLQGRRVTDTSKKGMYIINGKKVVIK